MLAEIRVLLTFFVAGPNPTFEQLASFSLYTLTTQLQKLNCNKRLLHSLTRAVSYDS